MNKPNKKYQRKKIIKKRICVPTLPIIFRPVTRNTVSFLFGLIGRLICIPEVNQDQW